MERLAVFVQVGMPWLSAGCHHVMASLVHRGGYPGSADGFAASAGFRNRYQLSRILQREGLPSLEELAGWIRLLTWVAAWEASRVPLSQAALRSLRDPAPMFRLVERLTGRTWTEVRALGADWVFLRLLDRCRPADAPACPGDEAIPMGSPVAGRAS